MNSEKKFIPFFLLPEVLEQCYSYSNNSSKNNSSLTITIQRQHICARIYRPNFRENKPKTIVFYDFKSGVFGFFHENWVFKFGHWSVKIYSAKPYKSCGTPLEMGIQYVNTEIMI